MYGGQCIARARTVSDPHNLYSPGLQLISQ